MPSDWMERPEIYRKVFFSLLAFVVALVLFLKGLGVEDISGAYELDVARAVYYGASGLVFILGLLPWAWVEQD